MRDLLHPRCIGRAATELAAIVLMVPVFGELIAGVVALMRRRSGLPRELWEPARGGRGHHRRTAPEDPRRTASPGAPMKHTRNAMQEDAHRTQRRPWMLAGAPCWAAYGCSRVTR